MIKLKSILFESKVVTELKKERIFKSEKTKKKFKESELTQKNARKIASKLGFGSGHEIVELIKIDEETYRLFTVPYFGAPTQTDEFILIK